LVYLYSDLGHELSAGEKELITSITSGGAFFGAIAAEMTADRFGRKGAIYMGCALFIIGAILQAAAYSVAQMTVGRLIVGLGVGSAAMIVPLYIAEVTPARYRGRMIGLDNMLVFPCASTGRFRRLTSICVLGPSPEVNSSLMALVLHSPRRVTDGGLWWQ